MNNVYEIVLSLFLYLVIKPLLLICKIILYEKKYKKFCFILIGLINYLYPLNRIKELRRNEIKYNLINYHEESDKKGINLYFKCNSPLEIIKNKKILDFGCGVGGKDCELIKFNPKKIIGIDLSERNIKYARKLINQKTKKRLFFYKKDILLLKEKFDTILSFTVFEHLKKKELIQILNKMADLLKKKGKVIIVFNHYNDRFGTHLKEYIYHPWPQTIFEEEILFKYWNSKLKKDKKISQKSYFPIQYEHGINSPNSDCFMNLNKVTIQEFEEIIKKSKLRLLNKYLYSKSFLLKLLPFLPKKYLIGSAVYFLKK